MVMAVLLVVVLCLGISEQEERYIAFRDPATLILDYLALLAVDF
jgi:hypothetical protein